MNPQYESVSGFGHLLRINKQFLKNKWDQTYYHYGPFAIDTHINARDTLLTLHEYYRVYTTNGQSNLNENGLLQRGYVEFQVEEYTANKLFQRLCDDPRIYTSFDYPSSSFTFGEFYMDNMPSSTLPLTQNNGEDVTFWRKGIREDMRMCEEYPNVERILSKLVYGFIVCREYYDNTPCEDILLEHVEELLTDDWSDHEWNP